VTVGAEWLLAFPLRPASDAADALCESWQILAASYKRHFHAGKREPELTRVLKGHVENVTGRQRGLLGMWATESVINRINFETGEIVEERRTDIVYGWNNEHVGIQLVFEFKKLDRSAASRANYLGENGLLRFVTGIYGQDQPIAAMVGILIDSFDDCVPPLRELISITPAGPPLSLRRGSGGEAVHRPSLLFQTADFDTEHDRPAEQNPPLVRVAHIFLKFNYPPESRRQNTGRKVARAA
jgi:hypothetical protein